MQQERKRKEGKAEGVDGMGWTAGNKTGKEKSETILCTGSEVPEDTRRAGRDVGLQRGSPGFVLPGSPLPHPQTPTTKAANAYSPVAANEATYYPAAFQQRRG